MATYATVADLRADPSVADAPPPTDAELEVILVRAEDTVDRLIGPRPAGANGRKYDPAGILSAPHADALKRATLAIAVTAAGAPDAFDPPPAQSVSGPDFTLTNLLAGTAGGRAALERAAGILDAHGLRVLRAVVR